MSNYREAVVLVRRVGKSHATEYLAKKNGAKIQKPKKKLKYPCRQLETRRQ
jgi:hypothetical protein